MSIYLTYNYILFYVIKMILPIELRLLA